MAKVMIVDDEEDTVSLLKTVLEKKGFDISVAFDGQDCLKKLEQWTEGRPDLILLDIILPQISGWEVLKEIRKKKQFHQTKVIFISVKQPEEFQESTALRQYYSEYLTKPFDIGQLVETVTKTLESPSRPT